jgi:hypothetical protein
MWRSLGEEGLVASFSPLLSGASKHAVTHPEELTLNFRVLYPGSDCCMLPGKASNGSLMPNATMVKEGVFLNFIIALFIFYKYSRM